MPRLVRRRPLTERIKDYLNPYDFLLWFAEELETRDLPWDQWAYTGGAVCNLVMIIAQANSVRTVHDDVFGDESIGGGVIASFASIIVISLTIASIVNAAYTFLRKRHYRLFESSVEGAPPSTPSARRVHVDSSPVASSPLRFFSQILRDNSAQARAHPDPKREVWEISVWDPLPANLRFFCTFSPGHAFLYWLFLPVSPANPRPSTTVATAVALAGLLTIQLIITQQYFSQQSKDTAIVQREVMNEYDTKFVHPRTQPVMRDVGTQFDDDEHTFDACETYMPVTVVNRGFRTNPNPNYMKFVDPDIAGQGQTPSRSARPLGPFGAFKSPPYRDNSSPLQRYGADDRSRAYRASVPSAGDGGNLGVYSHAQSPLKKAASAHFAPGRETKTSLSPVKPIKETSPLKRTSYSVGLNGVLNPRHGR